MDNEVADETEYFQVGLQDEENFYSIAFDQPKPSVMSTWPTKENPTAAYKYTSLILNLSQNKQVIER